VVDQGQSVKPIYLPAGTWFDYFRGSELTGGQVIQYNVDLHTWADIPVFIRKGSILASQPVQDYVDQRQISQVTLDIFPSSQASQFVYYDDDGNTYAYEKGVYFRQEITAQETGKSAMVSLESPTGTYTPALRTYLVRIHGPKARAVSIDGQNILESKPGQNEESLLVAQWSAGHDRYGEVTVLRIAAAASKIVIEH
jgi:alpha-glucosidase